MIRQLIQAHYDRIRVENATLFYEGMSNLWRIDLVSDDSKLVLKEMPARFTVDAAETEALVCSHLNDDGIPTSKFIKTKAGTYAFHENEKTYHLQQFIPGKVYRSNKCPARLVENMGEWLGRIHQSLRRLTDVHFKDNLGTDWFQNFNIDKKIGDFSEIRDRIQDTEIRDKEQLISDVDFRIRTLRDIPLDEYRGIAWNALTRGPTHGDYSCLQVLSNEFESTSIIDFTSACILPYVWEIARSFCQSDESARNGEIAYGRLKIYLSRYLRVSDLTANDIRHFFDYYYLQLLGSTFGYRQAATGILEKNWLWDLGHFAIWRTKMCRWLSTNKTALTNQLARDFVN